MKGLPSFQQVVDRFPALLDISPRSGLGVVPYVQQMTTAECGVACLAMVLRYYGKAVGLEELRDVAVSGRDGTNAQVLLDAARWYGLRGRAVTLDLDQLKCLERGTILHWQFNHFVVFDRLRRAGVDVVDPKRGRWRVPIEQFRRSFTGVALLFEPSGEFEKGRKSKTVVIRYLQRLLSERGFLPHILVTSVVLQGLGLALPLLNRLLIDRVIPHRDYHLLVVLAAGLVFVSAFQAWTSMVRSYLFLYLRTRLDSRMTLGFLDHLLDLPFDFFQRRTTGDLLVRLGSNSTVRDILTGTVLSVFLDGTLAVGYLVLLLALSLPMACVAFCVAGLQLALLLFARSRQRQFLAQSLQVQSQSQGYLVEMLAAVETLKALGAEHRAVERWSSYFAAELNVSLKRGRLEALLGVGRSAIGTISTLALLGTGTLQVLAGRFTLGDMMALIAVATGFLGPVSSLASAGTRLQLLFVYLERLNDVFDAATERDRLTVRRAGPLRGAIGVEDISFRYSPISPFVVQDVSIEARPGEFLAIAGRSGAGKSTLARLLVGLYAPTSGRVCYDGVDLLQMDVSAVRRQIGVVTQQAQLFGGSIRSNIALSDPALPFHKVVEAAKGAQIHDDVMAMPMGYETLLIDRGASLSGGQQQRLALARALASQPRILVLDEATSQLDAATERAVHEHLAKLQCTRIVVAHRLSTIRHADRILVMHDGRIVEQGSHEDLLRRKGYYAELVAAQMSSRPAFPAAAENAVS